MNAYLESLRYELTWAKDPQHIADVEAEIARVTGETRETARAVPVTRRRKRAT